VAFTEEVTARARIGDQPAFCGLFLKIIEFIGRKLVDSGAYV
jgi:hypothetical protein